MRSMPILAFAITAFLALSLLFFRMTRKTYPGFGFWTAGVSLLGLGYLFWGLRGFIPHSISIFVLNGAAPLGIVFQLAGMRRFLGLTPMSRLWYALPAGVLAAAVAFYYAYDSIAWRTLIVSSGVCLPHWAMAFLLLRQPIRLKSRLYVVIGSFLALAGAIILVRATWAFFTTPFHLFLDSSVEAAFFSSIIVLLIGETLAFLMLNSERMETELAESETGLRLAVERLRQSLAEQNQVEASLRTSEKRYRDLVDNANDIIFRTDANGFFELFNTVGLRLTGFTQEEMSHKHYLDIVHPDFKKQVERFYGLQFVKRVPDTYYEVPIITKEGNTVWVGQRVQLVMKDDSVIGFQSIARDITDRKNAEEARQASEYRYKAIFENATVGINIVDAEGRFIQVNDAMSHMLGYTREELSNLTIFDVSHPDDAEPSRLYHSKMVLAESGPYRFQKRYVKKDGCTVWADVYVYPLYDSAKGYVATVGMISDITQRVTAEAEREQLASAIEQAAEMVVITDVQGDIRYVNPAFEKVTGYTRDEVMGKNPRFLKSGEHDREFYEHLWNTIKLGQIWTGRMVNKRKDGSLYHEEATISPVKDSSGKITNFVAVRRDITEHLELSRQLLQAQKMEAIGNLAGGIAHDFNNILQVVIGYSELMATEEDLPDRFRNDLERVLLAARDGADLVQGLLTFSRRTEPKQLDLNLNQCVRRTHLFLERTLPRMIAIELILADDLELIHADPAHMAQMLMNLAVNARDAMPDGGKLVIETENAVIAEDYARSTPEPKPGKYVLLRISDTGQGMDGETIEHIFEPFFTTKATGRGTGLGLAMVYGIVKQHNGHITVQSEIGKGTVFCVYLPTVPDRVEPEVEDSGVMLAFGTETVLLVDDEEAVRELGARILTRYGYTVMQAVNGREALDLFKKESSKISLVILDLIMPEMGGTECLKELMKIDPQVKVLVASGYSADASAKETIEIGAKGFVTKPFRVKELLRDVRKVLDKG